MPENVGFKNKGGRSREIFEFLLKNKNESGLIKEPLNLLEKRFSLSRPYLTLLLSGLEKKGLIDRLQGGSHSLGPITAIRILRNPKSW